MAHVHKADLQPGGQLHFRLIIHADEQLHGRFGVLHRVHRFNRGVTGTLCLAVFPLSFKFLNVRRVPQHNVAQLRGRLGGVNFTPEAVAHQQWQQAGMVDVGMRRQHTVDLTRGHRDGLVLVDILALFHAAVDQIALPGCFQQCTAACYFMVRTQKCQFHKHTSRYGLDSSPIIPHSSVVFCPNRSVFLGQNAETLKNFLDNLDKPP